MLFKVALVLGAIALATALPLSYVNSPAPGQQVGAPAQPQYRYVQQPSAALYQPQAQPQQQQTAAIYQQQPQAPPQRKLVRPLAAQEPEEYEPPQPYNFAFDVRDDHNTNYQNRQEQREGDTVKGSYSVVDSDGFIRTVKYTADPIGGFKAEVSREPTDIKVLIPTPAPAVPSVRQQQTQQYLQGAQQYQAPQAQVYSSLSNPAQYRAPAPARPAQRQQYAAAQPVGSQQQLFAAQPAPQQQVQYAAAPAQGPKAYAQPAAQYQGYPQQ